MALATVGYVSCYQGSPHSVLPVTRISVGITKFFFFAVNEVSECIIVFYCRSSDRHATSVKIMNTFKKFGYLDRGVQQNVLRMRLSNKVTDCTPPLIYNYSAHRPLFITTLFLKKVLKKRCTKVKF